MRVAGVQASIAIDVPAMTYPVEEDPGALDVIADAVIADAQPPLTDPHIRQATSRGLSMNGTENWDTLPATRD